jgi:hypothetical protein
MRRLVSIGVVFCACTLTALAQSPNVSRGQGYVFFAPGFGNIGPDRAQADVHIGAGGEGFIYKGLGLGAEIGPVGPLSTSGFGWSDFVVGLGSANLSYHLLPGTSERKLEPFVTAGYSLFFRAGISQGYNAGFGVNRWLKRNVAMRFEVRRHFSYHPQFTGFRMGLTFR